MEQPFPRASICSILMKFTHQFQSKWILTFIISGLAFSINNCSNIIGEFENVLDNCGNFLHTSLHTHVIWRDDMKEKNKTKTSKRVQYSIEFSSSISISIFHILFSFVQKWMVIIRRKLMDLRVDYYNLQAISAILCKNAQENWILQVQDARLGIRAWRNEKTQPDSKI